MNKKKKRYKIAPNKLRKLHRYTGYFAIFFVLILSITGLILNRTVDLELNDKYIKSNLLALHYGIAPKTAPLHFKIKDHYLSWSSGILFLNFEKLTAFNSPPIGIISIREYYIFAARKEILLTQKNGVVIETITNFPFDEDIASIGKNNRGKINIRVKSGLYQTDENFTKWDRVKAKNIIWSAPLKNTKQLDQSVNNAYMGKGISLYKFILDLHSGKILGKYGSYLMDFSAIALIILSISGLFNRKKSKPKYNKHIKINREVL